MHRAIYFSNRCSRLQEIKCCTRKSRVAPTEPTVCCPPERRCGAICRRVFGCCSCKRTDTQQRTKNTRAKHSLTSVAPPPLSEVRGYWGIEILSNKISYNFVSYCYSYVIELQYFFLFLFINFNILKTAYQI